MPPIQDADAPKPGEVLWQTIVGDYPSTEFPLEGSLFETYDCWYQAQRQLAGRDKSSLLASIARKPDVYEKAQTFEDLKAASLHDRPVFSTTDKCLLGNGPKGLLPGDLVCIVKGTITPFLLRPNEDAMMNDQATHEKWKLVGGCFVHGLMYGEGLNMGNWEELAIL